MKTQDQAMKCQNPEKDCLNDASSKVEYDGQPLMLCEECGPEYKNKPLFITDYLGE